MVVVRGTRVLAPGAVTAAHTSYGVDKPFGSYASLTRLPLVAIDLFCWPAQVHVAV